MIFLHNKKRMLAFKLFAVALMLGLNLSIGMLTYVPQARADCWGCTMAAAIMKQTMETIQRQVEGALLGSLKVAAVEMLNKQVNQLVGGSTAGKALFITDMNDFLFKTPAQQTEIYMNDFFSQTTRGKASSANYVGIGDAGSAVSGNYTSYLVTQAKNATVNSNQAPTYDLDQYTPNPETMFQEGDMRAFNAFFSNPANNPFGYTLMAEQAYQSKLATEQKKQEVKATASGFLPVEKNGKIVSPAATVEAISNDVKTLSNKVIAAASNPAEFLSGVVSAMATKAIQGIVDKGIGEVQTNLQREIGNVDTQVANGLKSAASQYGPGAQYDPALLQRLNASINTQTPPPPASIR